MGDGVVERGSFDSVGFFSALDAIRAERGLNWKQVASEVGVSQSTLTRLAQGRRPDVDSLAALVDWGKVSADDFVIRVHGEAQQESIATIATYLRADRNLTAAQAEALESVIRATYNALRQT